MLLAVIVTWFSLEMLWGDSTALTTLVSMGALVRERAFDEPWRLLSCTLLHAGTMHLLLNAYVLLLLGSALERILGHERFLVLFVLSALGGSLASTVFIGQGISVGASGGVWGLLTAHMVLALRPRGLLPESILPEFKKVGVINLGLNLLNSLRPEVDWAAHLGGGLVGGSLVLAGILTVGLLPALQRDSAPKGTDPRWLRPAAFGLAALLGLSGMIALVQGQPWTVGNPIILTPRPLGTTGLRLSLPAGLTEPETVGKLGNTHRATYGDLFSDLLHIDVVVGVSDTAVDDEELERNIAELQKSFAANVPPEAHVVLNPKRSVYGERRLLSALLRFDNGLVYQRAAVFRPHFFSRVDVLLWPEMQDSKPLTLAERIVRSLGPVDGG